MYVWFCSWTMYRNVATFKDLFYFLNLKNWWIFFFKTSINLWHKNFQNFAPNRNNAAIKKGKQVPFLISLKKHNQS
jgi:hypothetical protein